MATDQSRSRTKNGRGKRILLVLLSLYVVLGTIGFGIDHFYSNRLPSTVRDAIETNTSPLRLVVATGLAAIMAIVIFQEKRRSSRSKTPAAIRSKQVVFEKRPANTHPLFLTPRATRDNNFVFRKTKSRGRIHRNRAGEKIPHRPNENE